MTALAPITCANPAHTAAKVALVRRIEAASRANEDRQDAPRGGYSHAKPASSQRAVQPAANLAAHILGARHSHADVTGYVAYEKSARLLALESHVIDITLR